MAPAHVEADKDEGGRSLLRLWPGGSDAGGLAMVSPPSPTAAEQGLGLSGECGGKVGIGEGKVMDTRRYRHRWRLLECTTNRHAWSRR